MGPLFDAVLEHYGDDASLVFKHFPLSFHKQALPASLAAAAAHEQGKFWEYSDLIFKNMRDLTDENFVKWAEETGLDVAKFKASYEGKAGQAAIDADMALAKKVGVRGTPTIFVNGRRYQGPRDPKGMIGVIDTQILGKKPAAAPPGAASPAPAH